MSGYAVRWPRDLRLRPIQAWPGEHTGDRTGSPFRASWSDTISLLSRELTALNARTPVLQVAISEDDFRLDGYPRAQAKASHPGVILSFDHRHGSLSFPCDRFADWQDNVRAIALAMEALRKVDRYGITRRGEQYTGWRAIGSGTAVAMPGAMTADEAYEVVARWAQAHVHEIKPGGKLGDLLHITIRRAKAQAHPDRNDGDRTGWDQVEQAARALGVD